MTEELHSAMLEKTFVTIEQIRNYHTILNKTKEKVGLPWEKYVELMAANEELFKGKLPHETEEQKKLADQVFKNLKTKIYDSTSKKIDNIEQHLKAYYQDPASSVSDSQREASEVEAPKKASQKKKKIQKTLRKRKVQKVKQVLKAVEDQSQHFMVGE